MVRPRAGCGKDIFVCSRPGPRAVGHRKTRPGRAYHELHRDVQHPLPIRRDSLPKPVSSAGPVAPHVAMHGRDFVRLLQTNIERRHVRPRRARNPLRRLGVGSYTGSLHCAPFPPILRYAATQRSLAHAGMRCIFITGHARAVAAEMARDVRIGVDPDADA